MTSVQLMPALKSRFWAVRDYFAPVLRESKFMEHGRITPEEFVASGDFLAYKFPTWQWTGGDPEKAREYLPRDKQYLVNRGVPCFRRVTQLKDKRRSRLRSSRASSSTSLTRVNSEARLHGGTADDTERVLHVADTDEAEDWIVTHTGSLPQHDSSGDRSSVECASRNSQPARTNTVPPPELVSRLATFSLHDGHTSSRSSAQSPGENIPDMDEDVDTELEGFDADVHEKEDPAQFVPTADATLRPPHSPNSKIVSVRTYDCLITYDKYYQTPRMWLVGYDEDGFPLQPSQIFEDIASEYAFKTVTIEPFPHGMTGARATDSLPPASRTSSAPPRPFSVHVASIHPCKHASMMRKMIARMNTAAAGDDSDSEDDDAPMRSRGGWAGAVKKVLGGKSDSSLPRGAALDESGDGVRVDQYLVIFLKFMASIVPTIEIDATQAV
ncbi:E2-like enzyme [Malassezia sp. CBS 17886]|nr:E2-like enzyme [Malassezia sp. CBS 17886]